MIREGGIGKQGEAIVYLRTIGFFIISFISNIYAIFM